jgi:hypothetical protein
MVKRLVLVAAVLCFTALFFSMPSGRLYAFQQRLPESGMMEIRTENGILMRWKVDGDLLIVHLRAKTTGWVAVGFDPTQAMRDAIFIIGYVKNGRVMARDDFGTDRGKHAADTKLEGSDDVRIIDGNEENGFTEIVLSIPLDSGDSRDTALKPGREHLILLAFGEEDSFSAVHEIEAEAMGTIRL